MRDVSARAAMEDLMAQLTDVQVNLLSQVGLSGV
jgi:hypothetical protein